MACKDSTKIPAERLYEMNKKLHVVSFLVEIEGNDNQQPKDGGEDVGDEDDGDDKKNDDDEADDLDNVEDFGKAVQAELNAGAALSSKLQLISQVQAQVLVIRWLVRGLEWY